MGLPPTYWFVKVIIFLYGVHRVPQSYTEFKILIFRYSVKLRVTSCSLC